MATCESACDLNLSRLSLGIDNLWEFLSLQQEVFIACRPHICNSELNQTPRFEWYVVRCGSKNEHRKDMCLREIGLCAQ